MAQGWTLMIHGGAGSILRERISTDADTAARTALNDALDAGSAVLAADGHALDAVEAAVRVLEDDPSFNAGRGAAFTYEGANELDAAIMEGQGLRAGSVAGVTATRNPVTLARAVMEQSAHVLLGREGADAFSREHGLAQAGPDWFATPERRRQLDELKGNGGSLRQPRPAALPASAGDGSATRR
jgi:L-asparaginase / beta-aspartyl-peptidase